MAARHWSVGKRYRAVEDLLHAAVDDVIPPVINVGLIRGGVAFGAEQELASLGDGPGTVLAAYARILGEQQRRAEDARLAAVAQPQLDGDTWGPSGPSI